MIFNLQRKLPHAAYRVLHHSGVARWFRQSRATIFCYHNVVPDDMHAGVGNAYLHTGVTAFAEQLEWIAKSFTVVPVGELLARLRERKSVGGLGVITFDDGYLGVIRHAVPVLRKAGLPFALFPVIEAASNGRPFWWDLFDDLQPERRDWFLTALRGEYEAIAPNGMHNILPSDVRPANWEQLKTVVGDDCTIGVHTVTHRNLSALSPAEIEWELTLARQRLSEELGVRPTIVAYPYGYHNHAVQKETERAGFEAGLSLNDRPVQPNASMFDVARINVPAGIAMANFACWGSGLKLRR